MKGTQLIRYCWVRALVCVIAVSISAAAIPAAHADDDETVDLGPAPWGGRVTISKRKLQCHAHDGDCTYNCFHQLQGYGVGTPQCKLACMTAAGCADLCEDNTFSPGGCRVD